MSRSAKEARELLHALGRVYDAARQREADAGALLDSVDPHHRESARNLLHYAAIRSFDLRDVQARLSTLGLSSLGRAEASVLPSLRSVAENLARWLPDDDPLPLLQEPPKPPPELATRLLDNTNALLGPARERRLTRILVTAPSSAGEDPEVLRQFLDAGMDLLRINCAHDDERVWASMVKHLRQAEWETNRRCRILFDLAGPKLRTGPIDKPEGGKIVVSAGDLLWLLRKSNGARRMKSPTKKDPSAAPGARDVSDQITPERRRNAARIGCALPAAIDDLQVGHRVFFDDGKIAAKVIELSPRGALLAILAPAARAKLKPDKGINIPDTQLSLPALLPQDLSDLDFVVEHADLVGQSFLRGPDDVHELKSALIERSARQLGLILKVETPGAFARLPEVLLAGLQHRQVGVMVARGDLAVEVGFERLAEAQEEILWMAEAAHVPVIWATQVLENLAKKGTPTRAEVTDAAMSARAECVMLNKGPYVADAVRFLDDVLCRMASHQEKKRSRLRALSISNRP